MINLSKLEVKKHGSKLKAQIWAIHNNQRKSIHVTSSLACGMMVILVLRSCRPILAMSTSSITMDPLAASIIRNSARVKDDFPAPVRPTMPIYELISLCLWKCEDVLIIIIIEHRTTHRCKIYYNEKVSYNIRLITRYDCYQNWHNEEFSVCDNHLQEGCNLDR